MCAHFRQRFTVFTLKAWFIFEQGLKLIHVGHFFRVDLPNYNWFLISAHSQQFEFYKYECFIFHFLMRKQFSISIYFLLFSLTRSHLCPSSYSPSRGSEQAKYTDICVKAFIWRARRLGASERCQWEVPVGGASGRCQWEGPMGGANGRSQWEGPMGGAFKMPFRWASKCDTSFQ